MIGFECILLVVFNQQMIATLRHLKYTFHGLTHHLQAFEFTNRSFIWTEKGFFWFIVYFCQFWLNAWISTAEGDRVLVENGLMLIFPYHLCVIPMWDINFHRTPSTFSSPWKIRSENTLIQWWIAIQIIFNRDGSLFSMIHLEIFEKVTSYLESTWSNLPMLWLWRYLVKVYTW